MAGNMDLFLRKGYDVMTAKAIFEEMKKMDNLERIKLLDLLFDEYFDNRPPEEVIIKEKIESAWGDYDEH